MKIQTKLLCLLFLLLINSLNAKEYTIDILLDTAPMDDYKFIELYSTPYYFNK